MSKAVTGGRERNTFSKVYDRLRKRSYRRTYSGIWYDREHMAYVEGVRDALNAVASTREDA